MFLIVLSGMIVVLSLFIGAFVPTATQTTNSAMQIAGAVLLAVVGFHFGSRGVEQAQEQASKAMSTAAVAEKEREEAEEKLGDVSLAAKLNNEALALHYRNEFAGATRKYRQALEAPLTEDFRADILTNLSYVFLDLENPDYERVKSHLQTALDLLTRAPESDPWWIGIVQLALAVARGNLGERDAAAELLNAVGARLDQYGYLFDEKNLEPRHFDALCRTDAAKVYRREVLDFLKKRGIDLAKPAR